MKHFFALLSTIAIATMAFTQAATPKEDFFTGREVFDKIINKCVELWNAFFLLLLIYILAIFND